MRHFKELKPIILNKIKEKGRVCASDFAHYNTATYNNYAKVLLYLTGLRVLKRQRNGMRVYYSLY